MDKGIVLQLFYKNKQLKSRLKAQNALRDQVSTERHEEEKNLTTKQNASSWWYFSVVERWVNWCM